jgi:hypothetical protein
MAQERPTSRDLAGIALIAGSGLALQVLLTRLFSAVLFYHFSFLAISLGLLGTGAGALLVYVRPEWFARRALRAELARWAALLGVLLAVAPLVLVRLDYSFAGEVSAAFVAALAAASLIAALPFTVAGIAIALAIRGWTPWIGRVYGADLAGAGLGALAVVPLMWVLDAPLLITGLGLLAGLASMLLAPSGARHVAGGALAVAGALLVLGAATSADHLDPDLPGRQGAEPVSDTWTPLSRVVGYAPAPRSRFGLVFYDRVYAPVPVRRGTDPDWRALGLGPQSAGYAVAPPGRVLVIGGGGGRDVYNALSAGRDRVDVIELNRAIRDTVDHDLGSFSGAPYSRPGVSTTIGDGRSTLAGRDTDYASIHIGFTDTLSANSATAFALTESNLYTVEAFREYLDHLAPGGVLNVSRLHHLVGDEALRVTIVALEALKREGVADPTRNVVVLLGHDILGELFGTVLAKREPWTPAQLERLRALAAQRGNGVAYAPGQPGRLEWAGLTRAGTDWDGFCHGYRFDVCPPTDDRPFFFNMKRLGDVAQAPPPGYIYAVDPVLVLMLTLGILLVLAALAFAAPLALVRDRPRPPAGSLAFFAAIGAGFLLLEIVLVQRFVLFLGFPTYALSVVLFSLLLSTGLGSALSGRVRDPRRALQAALLAVCAIALVAAFALQPLLRALIDLPFALRVVLSVALIAPLGVALGMAMPIGLRRMEALWPEGVTWAWAVNGVVSVLASVGAVAIALYVGFAGTTLAALACYLLALAHARFGRWPARAAAPGEGPAAPEPEPAAASRV